MAIDFNTVATALNQSAYQADRNLGLEFLTPESEFAARSEHKEVVKQEDEKLDAEAEQQAKIVALQANAANPPPVVATSAPVSPDGKQSTTSTPDGAFSFAKDYAVPGMGGNNSTTQVASTNAAASAATPASTPAAPTTAAAAPTSPVTQQAIEAGRAMGAEMDTHIKARFDKLKMPYTAPEGLSAHATRVQQINVLSKKLSPTEMKQFDAIITETARKHGFTANYGRTESVKQADGTTKVVAINQKLADGRSMDAAHAAVLANLQNGIDSTVAATPTATPKVDESAATPSTKPAEKTAAVPPLSSNGLTIGLGDRIRARFVLGTLMSQGMFEEALKAEGLTPDQIKNFYTLQGNDLDVHFSRGFNMPISTLSGIVNSIVSSNASRVNAASKVANK